MSKLHLKEAPQWQVKRPPFDEQPIRQFVAVVGRCTHSGMAWDRRGYGDASIEWQGRQGYVAADIERIERREGMDAGSGVVVAWMPAILPSMDPEWSEANRLPDTPRHSHEQETPNA